MDGGVCSADVGGETVRRVREKDVDVVDGKGRQLEGYYETYGESL